MFRPPGPPTYPGFVAAGRYAPSPTGDLHLGNLRTALLAWVFARSTGRDFYLRLEDLDQGRVRDPGSQIEDLRAIGIDWDGPIVVQSERIALYEDALASLANQGQVFECFCSRRDIREAASAAHTPPAAYPGTCHLLSEEQRMVRREEMASRGLKPALRLLPEAHQWTVHDQLHGEYEGPVQSVVLRRGDGAFAYNLAVVVDDLEMGIDQVVRGDDLLESAPTQAYLSQQLGGTQPAYVHVPLVLGPTGARLAKRDGSVTLTQLHELGYTTEEVVKVLVRSISPEASSAEVLLSQFNPKNLSKLPLSYCEPLNLE